MTSSETEAMLDLPSRPRLALIYNDYGVRTVEVTQFIKICAFIFTK